MECSNGSPLVGRRGHAQTAAGSTGKRAGRNLLISYKFMANRVIRLDPLTRDLETEVDNELPKRVAPFP